MSGLAVTGGVPIPLDEIRFALESVAVPGYTGSLELEISLREDVAKCVLISAVRREVDRADTPAVVRQVLPDPERRKPVQSVIERIQPRLVIRPVLTGLEFHLVNGVLQPKFTVQE